MSDNKPLVSVIDLGKLSEPLTKLIETVAGGFGTLYEPRCIREEAKAKAEAERILAQAEADVSIIKVKGSIEMQKLALRASERFSARELQRQRNLEAIVDLAGPQLPASVSPEKVDEDWVTQFFNYAQDISNTEMQSLWARLLAGEVGQPGSFSPRTLQLIRLLRPKDASLFQKFCNYIWKTDEGLFNFTDGFTDDLLENRGLGFEDFLHLDSLGLVPLGSVGFKFDIPNPMFEYGVKKYRLKGLDQPFSVRLLTETGKELISLCDKTIDNEYLSHWIEFWRKSKVEIEELIE